MKFLRRFHRTSLRATKPCHLMGLPTEICLLIYSHLVPDGFLPYAHYCDYVGLFLSCSRIKNEMTHESVRLAPRILRALHDNEHEAPLRIRPLWPVDFPSLMHMTNLIPRWAMFSESIMSAIYNAMAPFLGLHLSNLTIGLENIEDLYDVLELLHTLDTGQRQWYMEAMVKGPGTTVMEEDKPMADCYCVLTTYNDIAKLATPIRREI